MMLDQVYLSHIELSEYKTIINLKTDFVPGLNIVIGKNGSGKTNFLDFLYRALTRNYKGLLSYETDLVLTKGKNIVEIKAKKDSSIINSSRENLSEIIDERPEEYELIFSNEKLQLSPLQDSDITKQIESKGFNYGPLFIKHGLIKSELNKVIDSPYSFSISYLSQSNTTLITDYLSKDSSYFLRAFCGTLVFALYKLTGVEERPKDEKFSFNELEIREDINRVFKQVYDTFNYSIKEYLPINEVRLNESYLIYHDSHANTIKVENIYFEFLVEGDWLPFSSLSDGTKRIFYIYSELISPRFFDIPTGTNYNKIILLEEPELGIHPHQLHNLMSFIKDISNNSQVIITTHSPMVLDILNVKDLGRLQISSLKEKKGTQLEKLSKIQLKAAKHYMNNESYLSDYWRYSDLNLI